MADDEVLKTLQEMRDLQKTQIELYKQTLSNQQKANRRLNLMMPVVLFFVLLTAYYMLMPLIRR